MTVDISVSLNYGRRRSIQKINSQKIKMDERNVLAGQTSLHPKIILLYQKGGITLCSVEETICLFSYYCFAAAATRIMVAAVAASTEETVIAVILFFGSYCLIAFAATKTAAANKIKVHTKCGLRATTESRSFLFIMYD